MCGLVVGCGEAGVEVGNEGEVEIRGFGGEERARKGGACRGSGGE